MHIFCSREKITGSFFGPVEIFQWNVQTSYYDAFDLRYSQQISFPSQKLFFNLFYLLKIPSNHVISRALRMTIKKVKNFISPINIYRYFHERGSWKPIVENIVNVYHT